MFLSDSEALVEGERWNYHQYDHFAYESTVGNQVIEGGWIGHFTFSESSEITKDLNNDFNDKSLVSFTEALKSANNAYKPAYDKMKQKNAPKSWNCSWLSNYSGSSKYYDDTSDGLQQMTQKIANPKTMKKIIDSTSWCNINVFKNSNATEMTGLSMNKCVFISNIKSKFNSNKYDNINLIPIRKKSDIEYILIVQISEDVHIGISLKYILETSDIQVMDIYLDKQQIQNQLVTPNHTYDDLDRFQNDNIYTLIINDDNTEYFKPCTSYETELYSETESEDWEDDETDDELDGKWDDIDVKQDNEFFY